MEGEWGRWTPPCVPARPFLGPSPVMLLTPVFGEAATTSWPRWRRMGTVFEPIRPVPPITTIFIPNLLVRSPQAGVCDGCATSRRQRVCPPRGRRREDKTHQGGISPDLVLSASTTPPVAP